MRGQGLAAALHAGAARCAVELLCLLGPTQSHLVPNRNSGHARTALIDGSISLLEWQADEHGCGQDAQVKRPICHLAA